MWYLGCTEVAVKINMIKENFVKERHPYSISSCKDGRFITTVRKENEERQQIAAPSYVELISNMDKALYRLEYVINT